MAIICTRCHGPVVAKDVNLNTALGRCRACAHVFDVRPQVQAEGGALALPEPRRPLVTRPAEIRVIEAPGEGGEGGYRGAYTPPGELVIERRWRSTKVYGLVVFCVFWDGFLVFWYSRPEISLQASLFTLFHVAIGGYMTYMALALLFNRTTIRATPREIAVRHGPLPWPGSKVVGVQDVEQLYCESVGPSRFGFQSESREPTFQVSAVLRDGRKLPLVRGLPEPDQALFIERRLEEHLGIDDAPVAGELGC